MPIYIAIEGPWGCGISTLLERLPQRLQAYGVKVAVLGAMRPVPDPSAPEPLAAGGDEDALRAHRYALHASFQAARVPHDAQLVLGERSILTSYAAFWERIPAGQKRQHIERVDAMENLVGLPDHALVLDIPEEQLLTRRQSRHGRHRGKHDQASESLCGLSTAYREMRERGSELGLGTIVWHDIDASASPDVVLARAVVVILQILGPTIGKRPAIALRRGASSSALADRQSRWPSA